MSMFANNALLGGGVRVRVWIREQRKIKRRSKALLSLWWQTWTSLFETWSLFMWAATISFTTSGGAATIREWQLIESGIWSSKYSTSCLLLMRDVLYAQIIHQHVQGSCSIYVHSVRQWDLVVITELLSVDFNIQTLLLPQHFYHLTGGSNLVIWLSKGSSYTFHSG